MRPPVMVVEDDFEIRESIIEALEDLGYACTAAPNGEAALNALRRADPLPCLILLDMMMPVMDGRAFLEARAVEPRVAEIPVVVLSAYRDVASAVGATRVAEIIAKPVPLSLLKSVVQRHCSAS